MLKIIRENPDKVRENISRKLEKASIDPILAKDEKRRAIIQEVEKLKNLRNIATQEIAVLKKNKENADEKIAAMKEVSDKIKELDDQLRVVDEELEAMVLAVPNMLHESVPTGKTPEDNPVVRSWGEVRTGECLDHIEICKNLDLIDFERGAKVSGSGFHFYTGKGASLERALINFMLDLHTDNGYKEIMPPFMVNQESMRGTGQLPKMAEDMYTMPVDDMYMIPTAEVPLTNFYAQNTLNGEELPVRFCGYSPCFRREAGSYGKDTRGLLRLHQFNKVELVKFVDPEGSYDELEALVADVEKALQTLKIPYRVILLCSGDTSFSSAKTYDIEVWSPADKKWLEVSSCSNFEDFQARRANIRFKRTPSSKPEFLHTLNGSGLATPRLMAAILENYTQADGTFIVPDALRRYVNFDKIEKK
jgi:seryl-tRNA synthetase